MRLLYLSYWGVNEGLSRATVLPHLEILAQFKQVEKIIFCSIERSGDQFIYKIPKVIHVPLVSRSFQNVFVTKANDLITFPSKIVQLCRDNQIDFIICRSSPAGMIGHLVWMRTKTPYLVESFEPHADYMLESGVWSRYDPRYRIQKFFEKKIKATARYLLPVSTNYRVRLMQEGIPADKLMVVPCCVSVKQFGYNVASRNKLRTKYAVDDNVTVGIYVGKFDGIYFDREAFRIFKEAFDFFRDQFRLILLTNATSSFIQKRCVEYEIPMEKVIVDFVAHEEVPQFLAAADFAFSTIKPSPSRIFCSPIKNAEYWASGLPILLCRGIGDDSRIIENEGGGVVMDLEDIPFAMEKMKKLVDRGREENAVEISSLAKIHRDFEMTRTAYRMIFDL